MTKESDGADRQSLSEQLSHTPYVHHVGWEDWPSQVADSMASRGLEAGPATYVLVALSGALPEHRAEVAALLPVLDAASSHRLQFIVVGVEPATEDDVPVVWNEVAAATCLSDLALAANWPQLPRGALATLSYRWVSDEQQHQFDLEAYFVIEDRTVSAAGLREIILGLSQLLPADGGPVDVASVRKLVRKGLTVARIHRSASVIQQIADAVLGRSSS